MHFHRDWIVPDWPAPAGVRAVLTTRAGGVSAVPFDSMNLGGHVGDAPHAVQANRALLRNAIGSQPVFLDQAHGRKVLTISAETLDGQVADACVTVHRKLACTILVADCLPVLLTTPTGSVVAAAHAGWRGLAGIGEGAGQGVLESVYACFSAFTQAGRALEASKTIAWLGPCIGPAAFEVGAEVKAAFEFSQPEAERFFVAISPGKYLANLPALARLRLQAMGITKIYGNDGTAPWCTVSNPSRFFSHRRDAGTAGGGGGGGGNGFGTTGRMAACIWLE